MLTTNRAGFFVKDVLSDACHTKMMPTRRHRVIADRESVQTNSTRIAFEGQVVEVTSLRHSGVWVVSILWFVIRFVMYYFTNRIIFNS